MLYSDLTCLFIFLVLEQSQRQLKVLSIAKQNSILLPEKSGESSLVSRERAKKGSERRKNFRGEPEEELQRARVPAQGEQGTTLPLGTAPFPPRSCCLLHSNTWFQTP